MIQSNCPSEDTLNRLLNDALEDSRHESLNQHLEECTDCQSRLDALTSSHLGVSLPTPNIPDPAISQLISHLSSLSPSALESIDSASSSDVRFPGPPTAEAPLGQLGKYQIQELVGSGASGLLYRAIDPRIDREVAIKVLRSELASHEESRRRLKREARAAAGLNHDGVVRLFEFGDTPDFPPYLVMEYIQGESIAQRLKRCKVISAKESVELAIPIARALAAAHELGLVHRDVKPSNILLDGNQNPKIADFGLALIDDGNAILTRKGALAGTPAFISPEQILDPHQVDGRTDTYSLGVVLYRMLTGQRPFQGVARMTLLAVLHKDPPSMRQYNDEIPRDLETIVLKAMSKDREKRYTTANEFADDLQRWADGKPIHARPVGRLERFWRWCKRNPWIAILLATVAALLLTVTIGSVLASLSLSAARHEAEEQRDLTLKTLQSIVDEVQVKLYEATSFNESEAERALLEVSVRGFREITERTPDSSSINISSAAANIRLGKLLYAENEYERAKLHFEKGHEILESLGGEDSKNWSVVKLVIELLWHEGGYYSVTGKRHIGEAGLLKAIRVAKKAHQRWPDNFDVHLALARCQEFAFVCPPTSSESHSKDLLAADALKTLQEMEHKYPQKIEVTELFISVHYGVANYALLRKDYSSVLESYQAFLDQFDRLRSRGSVSKDLRDMEMCAYYDMGKTCKKTGDKESALKHFTKFIEEQKKSYSILFRLNDVLAIQREIDELQEELKTDAISQN